jgi:hypothetical protein
VASRKMEEWPQRSWELKEYSWRGRGEKSPLTGKQVRPVVAMDEEGRYHSGLRNWSYYANGKATDALYHHSGCSSRAEAISRARGMCKEWVAAHRELASDMKQAQRFARKASAAEKYSRVSRAEPVASRELRR